MISLGITEALGRVGTSLRHQPSRCLRRRFKQNRCSACFDSCPSQAITLKGTEVIVDQSRCTECLRCTVACPSEAIAPKHNDFFRLLEELAPLPQPTVACRRKNNLQGNAFVGCFGSLGYEHLLALALLLTHPVQLNLSACRYCPSGGILESLRQIHRDLELCIPAYRRRIRLVEAAKELDFAPRTLGRRDLFAFWKRGAKEETVRFLHHLDSDGGSGDLGKKSVPFRRRMLNLVRQSRPAAAKQLNRFFYYCLHVDERCKQCRACASMCPTGALKRGYNRALLFRSELCTACGLCVEFCPQSAMSLHTGYGADPSAERDPRVIPKC
jgi:ferredoxin